MNIRNGLIAVVSTVAFSAFAAGALAAGSLQATANATATVISPTTLTKTQDMAFGQIIRPTTGTNTVTLDNNDTTTIGGAGNGSVVASTTSSAKFTIVAPAGTTYTTTQTLSFSQTGFTNIAPSLPVPTTGVLGTVPVAGNQELRYGGQFDISSTTPAQSYTGTLSVTVNYN